jgi:hypothetical protein
MSKFRIFTSLSLSLFAALLLFPARAFAICPVCTIAVGAGVGLTRYFGVDDTITGVWIGGLTVSMIMWTINWLNGKNIKFIGRKIITTVAYYALIVLPLFYTGIMGHPLNKMWGIDKLLVGIILGSVFFFIFGEWYQVLKRKNGGKAHFPFQKVAMPVLPLVILSIIFYFITRG